MLSPVVSFRTSSATPEEWDVASKYFRCVDSYLLPEDLKAQQKTHPGATTYIPVINRYNALPFYGEVYKMIRQQGGRMLNAPSQHSFVADFWPYYNELKDFTFPSYRLQDLSYLPDCSTGWVVKGVTNSRKHKWNTHMRAPTRDHLKNVISNLLDDALFSEQDLVIREYVPLRQLAEGVTGNPVNEEYRFFVYQGHILAKGFYWSEHEEIYHLTDVNSVPMELVQTIANRLINKIPFVVLDFARTVDDRWKLVELNDGQMSGTSCVPLDDLYKNLKDKVT